MIFVAFGNTCGHAAALRQLLLHCEHEGIQTFVNTGDSAVGGPAPHEVIDLLRSHHVVSVQGERDRLLVRFQRKTAQLRARLDAAEFERIQAASGMCSSEALEYLRGLPHWRTVDIEGVPVAVCHGAPSGQSQRLTATDPPDRFRRQREIAPVEILICGHAGEPFVREVDGTLFVNPGSVGDAPDGRIHYAVISTEQRPFTADLRAMSMPSVEQTR